MNPRVRKSRFAGGIFRLAVGGLWLLAVGASMAAALRYESTPGRAGVPAKEAAVGNELVVVVHPQCPCTATGLQTLRRLLAEATVPVKVRVKIVAYSRPNGAPSDEAYAKAIPGADAAWISAEEAERRYGALTSGHVVAYRDGRPVFSGGVTPGRGVEGLAQAQLDLMAFLKGNEKVATAPVFGCALAGGSQ